MLGTRLGSKHGQDTSTTANIENNLVLEQVLVLIDRGPVRQGSHLILQHFLEKGKQMSEYELET
jgi:hypothetical protein